MAIMTLNYQVTASKYGKTALLLFFCLYYMAAMATPGDKPFVVPELKEWKGKEGHFSPDEHTRIVYNAKYPELGRIAQLLADEYDTMFHRRPAVVAGKSRAGDIEFALHPDKQLGEEGYTIRIAERVLITAPQPIGVYWATRTLLQLSEQHERQQLPKGVIRDYPDYKVRGFMMDCARKFIPMAYLRDLVKIMSYYKMNTLQIHLNDNGFKQYFEHDWDKTYAAFRLESDTYPGLTACDGFYTKREFINFQKDAMNYGIEIIPEIDVPAHSLAFSHYLPEIGSKKYGMDHLDMFAPQTYAFVDGLFREYLEGSEPVFCGKRVHIGTDEYSNEDKEVVEKFREFTDHYIRLVESYGKQACLWGALTHAKGDTPVKSENVVMNAWYNGFADPKQMVSDGYQLISIPDQLLYIVPEASYYHNYLEEEKIYREWTPARVDKEQFPERHPAILGGMFAVWNDLVDNGISVKDIHHRLFSSLQTIAVKMWTGQRTALPYAQFDQSRKNISEAPGVNQLGRVGKQPALVFEKANIQANASTGLKEIGYDYTVNFDLSGKNEALGTVLFSTPDATFYLSDPIRGLMGFARDGYLNTFRYQVREGAKAHIQIEGDSRSTTFKVNGKVIDRMDIRMQYYNGGKDSMRYVRTLVFPLEKSGQFNSKIENLKVYNYVVR